MGTNTGLRDELLGLMDKDAGARPGASRQAVRAILEKDAARLRRLKNVTRVGWILLAAAFLTSGFAGALTGFRSEAWLIASIIGLQGLLVADVALTFALWSRSRTLRMKEIQAALADIQERLGSLSESKPAGV
ncbi:MAG TPA: hypothetical protein VLN41_01510 [Candidatus Bathyarchaeia archaeon]|nr:hypothetical protein [Candidatus Bathyarchaeia archaeon]